jgi:hypothetical protein
VGGGRGRAGGGGGEVGTTARTTVHHCAYKAGI